MVINDYYGTVRLDDITNALIEEVKENCGVDIEMCMECGKCSGGCSNAHIFDYTPRKIVQMIKMGYETKLLTMDALWTCVSCQLCVDRCPSGINIPRLIDYFREKSYKQGIKPSRPDVLLFYELMLNSIEKAGKVAETSLMIKYNFKTRQYFKDADLGKKMFFKGKLNPFTPRVKKVHQIRRLFKQKPGVREG